MPAGSEAIGIKQSGRLYRESGHRAGTQRGERLFAEPVQGSLNSAGLRRGSRSLFLPTKGVSNEFEDRQNHQRTGSTELAAGPTSFQDRRQPALLYLTEHPYGLVTAWLITFPESTSSSPCRM